MNNKKKFDKILRDIKSVKIQGARNIAKSALYAYSLMPTKASKRKLISARPTEPMLVNVLKKTETEKPEEIKKHFDQAQEKINKNVLKLIKNNNVILTHCHSTNVVNSLIFAKKKGKNFEVYNTETRPLFQGRKTAKELRKNHIKVTMFVDSAVGIAIAGDQGNKKPDKIFLGADALLKKGVVNKIGSDTIAELSKGEKIPVYIIADSWKYSLRKINLEERGLKEVWENLSKKSGIKIKNPAFEFVPKKRITAIVSELGILKYDSFLRKMRKINYR